MEVGTGLSLLKPYILGLSPGCSPGIGLPNCHISWKWAEKVDEMLSSCNDASKTTSGLYEVG